MVSDYGMIAVSIISLAGMILLFILNSNQYFKKENFKIKKKAVMDENRVKIKKLERDLGIIGATKADLETHTPLETGANLLGVLKNLNGEQIQGLADKFLKPDDEQEYEQQPQSTIDKVIDFATNNPEMAAEFMKGLSKGKGKQQDTENVFN